MAALDERVAVLEGRVSEQSQMTASIREAFVSLDQRVLAFEQRMDRRFELVDQRFVSLETKLERRIDALDAKMSRQFIWLVGIVVTAMAAMLVAVVTR